MRYFVKLAYKGTHYFGWQRQAEQISVQQVIEEALFTLLRVNIPITGCGRTDTGVHASQYVLHFDFEHSLPENFIYRINKILPADIVFFNYQAVSPEVHARFDAYKRSYEYHLVLTKNPFEQETAYYFQMGHLLQFSKLQEAAQLLLQYEEFFPFCKSNTDVKTMKCQLHRSEWKSKEDRLVYHISANRFLRGMVRLIVGMCLQVSLGKIQLEEVQACMNHQQRLSKNLSVPPQGLFLSEVRYPESLFSNPPGNS